jgi:hypothetical protein
MPKKINKAGCQRQLKTHDRPTRRSMTSIEAIEQDERRREALTAQEKRQREMFAGFESQGGTTIFVKRRDQMLAVSEPSSERSLKPLAIKDPIETPQGSLATLEPFEGSVSPTSTPFIPPSTAPPALRSKKRARKYTTAYKEAFRDSQEDPKAVIKRDKAVGLLSHALVAKMRPLGTLMSWQLYNSR